MDQLQLIVYYKINVEEKYLEMIKKLENEGWEKKYEDIIAYDKDGNALEKKIILYRYVL